MLERGRLVRVIGLEGVTLTRGPRSISPRHELALANGKSSQKEDCRQAQNRLSRRAMTHSSATWWIIKSSRREGVVLFLTLLLGHSAPAAAGAAEWKFPCPENEIARYTACHIH